MDERNGGSGSVDGRDTQNDHDKSLGDSPGRASNKSNKSLSFGARASLQDEDRARVVRLLLQTNFALSQTGHERTAI